MKKIAVLVHGQNFLIQNDDAAAPSLRGFYVSAFIETDTLEAAEQQALELVRELPKLKKTVVSTADNHPVLSIDESAELTDWPDCTRPLSGFAFFEEDEAEEKE